MAKKFAVIFGIVFVLVGLLGFVSNPIVGDTGFFHTDALHNIVHLLVGIVLLIAAGAGTRASALWLKIWGAVYLVLFLVGLVQPDMLLGLVGANKNDTYLHLVLGVVLIVVGMWASKKDAELGM
jgi:hypothetical protein